MTIMAPSDEIELKNMVMTAAAFDDGPIALRYPRGTGYGAEKLKSLFGYSLVDDEIPKGEVIEIGKGRVIRMPKFSGMRGQDRDNRVAILSLGTRLHDSLLAAKIIEESNPDVGVTVADARFMKPLDEELIKRLADQNSVLITVEEGSVGGFGDHVMHFLTHNGRLDDGDLKVRPMVIPDQYFEAATQAEQYEAAGLSANHIANTATRLTKKVKVPVEVAFE
mmetsp:Transcript_14050/g.21345  ORF Transcript_14050/g.21345 Transcript_14050/m.21345 type:complete len:222 (+) Transcript_14050:2-667(+)